MQDTENTEIFVPEVDTSIVLTPTSDQPASVADVVAQAAGALSLDNETATAIVAMLDRMGAASVTTEDVEFLAKAFSCDEDLKMPMPQDTCAVATRISRQPITSRIAMAKPARQHSLAMHAAAFGTNP